MTVQILDNSSYISVISTNLEPFTSIKAYMCTIMQYSKCWDIKYLIVGFLAAVIEAGQGHKQARASKMLLFLLFRAIGAGLVRGSENDSYHQTVYSRNPPQTGALSGSK